MNGNLRKSEIIVGIGRNFVTEDGTLFQLQRREDIFKIKSPRPDEFLSSIWMYMDGLPVLTIPLLSAPALMQFSKM